MITAGIDIGSLATKIVLLNYNTRIIFKAVALTGGNNQKTAETLFDQGLESADLDRKDIKYILTTGYGRENIPFSDGYATEISCHAKGLNFLFPDARMILDIGGQDSKAIHIDGSGSVQNFIMNDKCSAGTGRFLEVIANALGVPLKDMGDISSRSTNTIWISNMCTVFAESEVVSQVAKGSLVPDIINGVHDAIAGRSVSMLKRLGIIEPIAMTGGVAQNIGVVTSLEKKLNIKLIIPENPQIIGALGAAIIARSRIKKVTFKGCHE